MSMRQFLLKKKPAALLLCLKDGSQSWYPSKLAHTCGASYVYVTHWLDRLEKGGWVKTEKKGRLKSVTITEAGLSVASALDEMVHKIDALTTKASGAAAAPSAQAHGGTPTHAGAAAHAAEGEAGKKEKEK